MRRIGPDFIDFWQGSCGASSRSRFGLRFQEGRVWVLCKLGDGSPTTYGSGYSIPVSVENLPLYVRMIVDDHVLNYPTSDLMAVLSGKESFQEALEFPSARAASSE